ncbi:hypothetical protein [Acetobacterium fimetarium]|uniref:hypothetical protein n=1 Tax=Acetobacterium fimetarium TaxID=52691 RepID=UPI001A9AACBB|nr:hypothetical protein [Acetobacterium fimetarium]
MSTNFENEPMMEIYIFETNQMLDQLEQAIVFDLLNGQKTAQVACPSIALYNVIITEKGKTPRNLS